MLGRLRAVRSSPYRTPFAGASDTVVAIGIAAMFLAVFLLRITIYNPNDGLGLLFCIPIAVAAVRYGPVVGLTGGFLSFLVYAAWAYGSPHVQSNLLVYSSRLVVFLVLGGFVGYFARAREEVDTRSRLLFDLSPDFMGTLDGDGRVVTANDAWRTAAGRSVEEALLPDWRFQLSDDKLETAFEEPFTLPDGSRRHIEWFVRRDPRGPLLYVVGRDVTERIEREAYVRVLLAAVQDARASERATIASDLHDYVLQQLLVALMHVERADSSALAEVDRFVRTATAALRGVIDGIQPLDFQHLDTRTVLERVASAVESEWGVSVERRIDVEVPVSQEMKLLAFRIVGEALRNAAKHAGVETVELDVGVRDGALAIRVHDSGLGLASSIAVIDRLVPQYHTGFNLLIEQVLTSGGTCSIQSAPGAGTTISAELPVDSAS